MVEEMAVSRHHYDISTTSNNGQLYRVYTCIRVFVCSCVRLYVCTMYTVHTIDSMILTGDWTFNGETWLKEPGRVSTLLEVRVLWTSIKSKEPHDIGTGFFGIIKSRES